jgi:hypothetical protein
MIAKQIPVAAQRIRGSIPVDAFPWNGALNAGCVDFDGTVVVENQRKAHVDRKGVVRAGRAIVGRVHGNNAYRRNGPHDDYFFGSVSEVRTRDCSLVYLYDGEGLPVGVLLFEQETIPLDDPELHLRLAAAALICCHGAPAFCTKPRPSPAQHAGEESRHCAVSPSRNHG